VAKRKKLPGKFNTPRGPEARYSRALRSVAREVGRIVMQYETYTAERAGEVRETLRKYADLITPWAREQAARAAQAVNVANAAQWQRSTKELGLGIRQTLAQTRVGEQLDEFQRENVALITSLPTEAGERVQRLTQAALSDSTRATELQKEIQRTGEVTKSRAMLIARTETSKAASQLTQARAESVGSEVYVWRTAEDGDVRPEHRRLDGKVFKWDAPPVAGPNGERYNPGQGPNCRCYAEPIITE